MKHPITAIIGLSILTISCPTQATGRHGTDSGSVPRRARATAVVAMDSLQRAIADLDDDDFFKREAASERVAEWMKDGQIDRKGYAELYRHAKKSRSFEVKHRLGKLLENAPLRLMPAGYYVEVIMVDPGNFRFDELAQSFTERPRSERELIARRLAETMTTGPKDGHPAQSHAAEALRRILYGGGWRPPEEGKGPNEFGVDFTFARAVYQSVRADRDITYDALPTATTFQWLSDIARYFPEAAPKGPKPTKWDL